MKTVLQNLNLTTEEVLVDFPWGKQASHLNSEKPDEEIMVECPELLRKSEGSALRGKYHRSQSETEKS